MNVGLFRTFTSMEISALAEGAGLNVLYVDDENTLHWHAVLRRS